MTTLDFRLIFYKKALKDYRYSFWFPFLKGIYGTIEGFCKYLDLGNNGDYTNYEIDEFDFPELYIQMPEVGYDGAPKGYGYWWEPGRCWPRIQALKKAIKETQHKIELENIQRWKNVTQFVS